MLTTKMKPNEDDDIGVALTELQQAVETVNKELLKPEKK